MGLSSDYPKTVTQQGGGWTGSQAGPLVGLGRGGAVQGRDLGLRQVLSQCRETKDDVPEARDTGGGEGPGSGNRWCMWLAETIKIKQLSPSPIYLHLPICCHFSRKGR